MGGWNRDTVEKQRIFVNTWYKGGTRLTGRSNEEVEEEAIQWATKGLIHMKDLLTTGGELILEVVFQSKYPSLNINTYKEIKKEMRGE